MKTSLYFLAWVVASLAICAVIAFLVAVFPYGVGIFVFFGVILGLNKYTTGYWFD